MKQCTSMANKKVGLTLTYGQCERKARVGNLCTQHEQVRLTSIRIAERRARRANEQSDKLTSKATEPWQWPPSKGTLFKRRVAKCIGCGAPASMSASFGPTCPDCYDDHSG